MIKLRVDSRDLNFHEHFGSVQEFPDEADFDPAITNPIEPAGAVSCTAISDCDVGTDQTRIIYDSNDLFALTPHDAYGADPRDTLGVMINQGLKPLSGGERIKGWKSYFKGETGPRDAFDNVRSCMMTAKSTITCGMNWQENWTVGPDGVMPQGTKDVSGHDFKISGWKKINGADCFKIKAWLGYYQWMPRDVFNKEIARWGCGTWMPATKDIDETLRKNVLEHILDLMMNMLLLMKQKLLLG